MPDMEDDWMSPKPFVRSTPNAEDKDEFIIERRARSICFGNPGSIVQWEFWSKHDSAAARDDALKKLSADNPAWHLRARTRNRWREQYGYPPVSHPGINKAV